jgi:hypothetical protein
MRADDVCPWIVTDRLPYPVEVDKPLVGQLVYHNPFAGNRSMFLFQGLTDGTFKLVSVSLNTFFVAFARSPIQTRDIL